MPFYNVRTTFFSPTEICMNINACMHVCEADQQTCL